MSRRRLPLGDIVIDWLFKGVISPITTKYVPYGIVACTSRKDFNN